MVHEKKPQAKFDEARHEPQAVAGHAAASAGAHEPQTAHVKAGVHDMQSVFGHMAEPGHGNPADERALRSRLDMYFSAWSHYGGKFNSAAAMSMYQPQASIEDIAPNMEKLLHQHTWQTHYGSAAEYGQAMNHLYNTVASFKMHWSSGGASITPEPGGQAYVTDLGFGATITTKLVPAHIHMKVHARIRWVKENGRWMIASETLHREGMKMPGIGSLNTGD